jgi:hypothetical protein
MDRRLIAESILLGMATNVLYELLRRFGEIPRWVSPTLTIILLLLLPFFVMQSYQFKARGMANVWRAKDRKFDLLTQIAASKKSLCFLGVSARTILQPQFESAIIQKLLTNHEFEMKFLLFDRRETQKLQRRATEETGDAETAKEWSEAMLSSIQMIVRIKRSLGKNGDRLHARTYKSFPVFRMLIADDEHMLVNHYARNRFPSDLPCLEARKLQDPTSFGYAFRKYFEEIWLEADDVCDLVFQGHENAPTDSHSSGNLKTGV